MKKVLITDNVHPVMLEMFENQGFQCDYFPEYTNEDVFDTISTYDGIIINSKTKIFSKVIDEAKKLKFIGRLGSGMEIIDVPYALKHGIQCFSVPEANCDAVGEHAIGMILSLFNNINNADKEVKNFIWEREKNRGIELGGKTIAIIGYGHTGKAFAKKLSGFDVTVLAYDKYLQDYSDKFAKQSSMKEIFEMADIVSFHLPFSPETHHLCDEKYINSFQKDIFIVNTSRGKVVNLKNIIFQIKNKKISGICLDVFENEKVDTYSELEFNVYKDLFQERSVLVSPHVAGWTVESKYKIGYLLAKKIINSINF